MNINSLKWIDFLLEYLNKEEYICKSLTNEEKGMLLMFHYAVWANPPEGDLVYYLNRLRNENKSIFEEIIELLQYNRDNIDFIEEDMELGYDCPLELYSKYNTD